MRKEFIHGFIRSFLMLNASRGDGQLIFPTEAAVCTRVNGSDVPANFQLEFSADGQSFDIREENTCGLSWVAEIKINERGEMVSKYRNLEYFGAEDLHNLLQNFIERKNKEYIDGRNAKRKGTGVVPPAVAE